MIDTNAIRQDFPIFSGQQLVYLDNAATTQKPASVIRAVHDFYTAKNATVRRSVYPLAASATQAYEQVRTEVQHFIGAVSPREIIFTSGVTEGINLVAQSFLAPRLKPGDEVLVSMMEHHANLIPWQQLCRQCGAHLRVIPINEQGELRMDLLPELLNARTRMLAIAQVSNSLGTINPIAAIVQLARRYKVPVLVDAAQSVAHYPLDVQALDCDFLVFSGHKMFAPSGVGILYGKAAHLAQMPPWQTGGEMIQSVTLETARFAEPPARFEAGTPNVEGAIGLGAAINYLNALDRKAVAAHLEALRLHATERLLAIAGIRIIGTAAQKTAIVSFTMAGIHPHDAATFLGEAGIALRAGHHCTQPLMDFFQIPGTLRASFTIYNTIEEIDYLIETIGAARRFFS
ncbi:MAG TPA: SufS family cysteine desulfurase [Saprospiraceae bacterium]|nr:SufS family cysteine desulfurase [Saprospiraceae bacterium]HMP23630.1 SufS family cysteine desulfurase [Saprospiraceae bacterium]